MRTNRAALPLAVLALGMLVHVAIGTAYALTRVNSLLAGTNDIGAFLQVMHSLVATGTPLTTLHIMNTGEIHWLGFHFTPIFYAIAPLFALFPTLAFLEIFYAGAVALAAIPLYLTARHIGLSRAYSCIAGLVYLFTPYALNASIWGFQDTGFAAPFMALALWAIVTHRFGWLVAASLLLLATKEHYGLTVASLGGLWWLQYRERRGLYLAVLGLAALALVLGVIMPHFSGAALHPMLQNDTVAGRYSWLFSWQRWQEVLPILAFVNAQYIFLMLAVFAFLPLFAPRWIFANIADLAVVMLSSFLLCRSPHTYYSVAIIPCLTVAACHGLRTWQNYKSKAKPYLAVPALLIACGLSLHFTSAPVPFSANVYEFPREPKLALSQQDRKAVADIQALFPPENALAAQQNIGIFFTNHRMLYVFPAIKGDIKALILHLKSPRRYTLMWNDAPETNYYLAATENLLHDTSLKIVYWNNPWVVLSLHGNEAPGVREEVLAAFEALRQQQHPFLQIYRDVSQFK